MIPTQVSKIWLGALAFLALWGILAFVVLGRQRNTHALDATLSSTQKAQSKLEKSLRLLSDMESSNRSYLIAPQSRAPFEEIKNQFSKEYKGVAALYAGNKLASAQLQRRFKQPFNRWFRLYIGIIEQRRRAGNRPSSALLATIAQGEQERAQVLDEARAVLEQFRKALGTRLASLESQQEAERAAVRSLTQATIGLGVFGIAGLAFMLARQGHKITESNESLRREIESRRRAERERQILANHDEQILNSTTEGIVGLNVKGRVTFVNPAAASMLGWEVAELIGKPWHDMAQHSRGDNTRLDKDASPVMSTLRDANARRISDDVFWKRTGRTFPVEYAVSPLYELSPRENEERQLSGATLTFRDITERKRSEIALLRLASVVESSKDAILSHLLDGTIVSCNASAVKMYGYSAREMEGQPLSVLFPPSRAEEALLLAEHIARGERIEPYQTTLLAKGGGRVEVAITFYPVLDARGNIMGASSNARPVRRDAGGNLPTFEALRVPSPASPAGNGAGAANGSAGLTARSEVGAAR